MTPGKNAFVHVVFAFFAALCGAGLGFGRGHALPFGMPELLWILGVVVILGAGCNAVLVAMAKEESDKRLFAADHEIFALRGEIERLGEKNVAAELHLKQIGFDANRDARMEVLRLHIQELRRAATALENQALCEEASASSLNRETPS